MSTDPEPSEALAAAIHAGDLEAVSHLVAEATELARDPLGGRFKTRTALHVVADWPGYFPNGPQTVAILVAAGADPNHRDSEPGSETPLHWAASSDDAAVAAALIDAGADIEIPGGSIGTPLDNAIGYGCWNVARLLVDRGAPVDVLWHAAALGMLGRLEEMLVTSEPNQDQLDAAFWQACHGGQRRAAERLLHAGANINASPGYANNKTPLDAATGLDTQRDLLAGWLREHGATPSDRM